MWLARMVDLNARNRTRCGIAIRLNLDRSMPAEPFSVLTWET